MMALPMLPAEHMEQTFEKVIANIQHPNVLELADCLRETWLHNAVWSV
jgi:hypothetical protein